MAQAFWLLEETTSGYRLGNCAQGTLDDLAVSREESPAEVAAAIKQALDERGYRGEPVLLALAASSCLAATVPHTGRAAARKHQALLYALEETLPLAAEDLVGDFVVFANDALGVAIPWAPLRPLVTALKESGARIVSIVPAAMLRLQGQVTGGRRRGRRLVVEHESGEISLFELLDGRPHAWRSFPAGTRDLAREVKVALAIGPGPPVDEIIAVDLTESLVESLRQAAGDIPVTPDESSSEAVLESAAAVLSGRQVPWIELYRDSLGAFDPYRPIRRSLAVFAVASACLLAGIALAAWLRAGQYEAIAQGYQERQEEVFRKVLPGARVPVGIRSRLESEYETLAGITGQMGGMPRLEPAMGLLRNALGAIPPNLRVRVLEMRAEQGQVYLDAEVRSHSDADLLTAALRKGGFRVPAPRTEQMGDKGVAVVIIAASPSAEEVAKKQGGSP